MIVERRKGKAKCTASFYFLSLSLFFFFDFFSTNKRCNFPKIKNEYVFERRRRGEAEARNRNETIIQVSVKK